MEKKRDIKSLSHDELTQLAKDFSQPKFRAKQLEDWLYATSCSSFDEMTNLPLDFREALSYRFFISSPVLVCMQESTDGTRKYLLELSDKSLVETVGIPSSDGSRLTVCFSSQVGCPMGCKFCATGRSGFTRNLSIGEMYDQVRFVSEDFGRRVSNVVCMGQGEPFLNYDAVLEALRYMNSDKGLGIGARHITISTCGILDGIKKLSLEPEQFTLAVSLHSAIQETRDEIMPGVKNAPVKNLREALKEYGESTKRRPSIEYTLIRGINDSDEHIAALIDFCQGILCHVNLIPLNPIGDEDQEEVAPSSRIRDFANALSAHGIECSVRNSRGSDIDGACGQLKRRVR